MNTAELCAILKEPISGRNNDDLWGAIEKLLQARAELEDRYGLCARLERLRPDSPKEAVASWGRIFPVNK